jgi:folate-binding protein YgfZ
MLLTMDRSVKDTVLAKLDQFIFSEDVQLGDVTDAYAQLAVIGPDAVNVVGRAVPSAAPNALSSLAEHGNLRIDWNGEPLILVRIADVGEPGFDLFVNASRRDALFETLTGAGADVLDAETADVLRIEAGVPLFHRDMDEETIPLEAGIESRAISFTKGCYVGQEIIIRVLHRGHGRVARRLVGLLIEGTAVPPPGTSIQVDGRDVGRVTSSAMSPALQRPIALAYVQRDFSEPGSRVLVNGISAVVSAVPFARG